MIGSPYMEPAPPADPSAWLPPEQWPHCSVCGLKMNPAATVGGHTSHPACDR